MKAVIVGCGIGGAAAALALQRQGSEVGAGLWGTANGIKALLHLGCAESVEKRSGPASAQVYRSIEANRVLFRTELGPEAARLYGAPSYFVHRPDLLAALVDALAPGTVRTDAEVAAVRQDANGATATLTSGIS
jgi:salicylate hydroxylase